MWILVDLCIVAVIALFTFLGYKKGLIGVAFSILSFIIAILIAVIIFKPVSTLIIEKTTIDDKIHAFITEKVAIDIDEKAEEGVQTVTVDSSINKYLKEPLEGAKNATIENASIAVADQITEVAIELVVFLIVYIVTRIIMMFLKGVIDLVAKLPIIKQFNKIGGTIYGVAEGIVIVLAVFAVISFLSLSTTSALAEQINQSMLGNFIYNNNILLKMFF